MIKRNMKRKPYRRAWWIDNAVMWALLAGLGYLFIIALLESF